MIKQLRQLLNDPDFPILSNQTLKFLDDVLSVLEDTISNTSRSSAYLPKYGKREDSERISVMEENLKIIINNLKVGKFAKERFVKEFPKWKKIRYDSIEKLNEICASMNTHRLNCNVAKLVGYSTSFLGGALTLASAITLIPTLGATTPLLISGAVLTGAGCSTAIGTSITEVVLLKTKIGQAQEFIEEDKNAFTNLGDWLTRAPELQQALVEIFNMCPYEDITNAIKDLVERASRIGGRPDRLRAIKTAVGTIVKMCIQNFVCLPLTKIATIISILVIVFQLLMDTKNRFVFDISLLTVRGLSAVGLFDDILDIASLVKATTRNAAFAGNLAKAISRGVISVFGMALDVVGIVFTSIDVSKGSLSPEAEKIAKAVEELKVEAERIERVYNSLS